MPPRLTEEERKARRSAQNARYYAAHREAIIARVSERPRGPTKSYAETAATRRGRENGRRLDNLLEAVHPSIRPIVQTLKDIGAAKGLYRSEMTALEDILTLVTAKMGEKPAGTVIAAPLPAAPPPTETMDASDWIQHVGP